jgi:hypothetical protein
MPSLLSVVIMGFAMVVVVMGQVEIDARFYTDDGCDDFGTACTDLAENSCCGVSQGGTVLYSSGDFYNSASGMGVNIQ